MNEYAGYPAWIQESMRDKDETIALLKSEIRDSYYSAKWGVENATNISDAFVQYGRMKCAEEIGMILGGIE